nr:hypothetical protein [Elizabethkingia sp. ASV34]
MIILRKALKLLFLFSGIYMMVEDIYTESGMYNSAHTYTDNSIKLMEEIPEKKRFFLERIYKYKAYIISEQDPLNVYLFIQKAYNHSVRGNHSFMYNLFRLYGNEYNPDGYWKALNFYLRVSNDKDKSNLFKFTVIILNFEISKICETFGSHKEKITYLKKISGYQKENRMKIRKQARLILQNEPNRNREHFSKENKNLLTKLLVFFFILLIVLIIKHQDIKKNKNRILFKKELKIIEKQKEIEKLQQQVNVAFSEVILLAKQNSPRFWIRFQEVHPQFCNKMLVINPNFKVSELTFCAYIYLGFTTKEIAEYTFKAIKTIENNRYNLRKKIKLSPHEDLMIWIRTYID